jgi:D-glycerate 3-kinase
MIDPRIQKLFTDWFMRYRRGQRPAIIGISGAQGSGKSTLARALAEAFKAAHFSLDDVYFSQAKRAELANNIHPLFATRGVPLTHDLDLLNATISALLQAGPDDQTPIPAFDKLRDAPVDAHDWPVFIGRPGMIIVEGWCVGANALAARDLQEPCNILEHQHDPLGQWRTAWNSALSGPYQQLFARFDAILYLAAPTFDVILDWRCEQEETLLGIAKGTLEPQRRDKISKFIQYFERLTRHMLSGGVVATAIAHLDVDRQMLRLTTERVTHDDR